LPLYDLIRARLKFSIIYFLPEIHSNAPLVQLPLVVAQNPAQIHLGWVCCGFFYGFAMHHQSITEAKVRNIIKELENIKSCRIDKISSLTIK